MPPPHRYVIVWCSKKSSTHTLGGSVSFRAGHPHRVSAAITVLGLALLTAACGSKKKAPVDLPPPTFTYSSADIIPWPWRMELVTITCTDLGGSSTGLINGKTYGLTGRDAIHWRIRGYEDYAPLLRSPDASTDQTLSFDARVERDCKEAYRARGEDVPG